MTGHNAFTISDEGEVSGGGGRERTERRGRRRGDRGKKEKGEEERRGERNLVLFKHCVMPAAE